MKRQPSSHNRFVRTHRESDRDSELLSSYNGVAIEGRKRYPDANNRPQRCDINSIHPFCGQESATALVTDARATPLPFTIQRSSMLRDFVTLAIHVELQPNILIVRIAEVSSCVVESRSSRAMDRAFEIYNDRVSPPPVESKTN